MVIAAAFWKLLGRFVKIASKEDWDLADLKQPFSQETAFRAIVKKSLNLTKTIALLES